MKKNNLKIVNKTLEIFTGMTDKDITKDLTEKKKILKWIVDNDISNLNDIGLLMSKYYRGELKI